MGEGEFTVGVCGDSDRRAALELALRSLPVSQRAPLVETLSLLRDEPLGPFDALVTAHHGDDLVAAAWAQPQPGRTASLWLPEGNGVRIDRLATPLIREAMRRTDAAGVQLTQVLLESPQDALVPDLRACGFDRITELQYLEWKCQTAVASWDRGADGLSLAPADSLRRGGLEDLVGRTYRETLDCPELEGLRDVSDVLSGYRQTGDYDPELWFVLRLAGVDAGVLLLNEYRTSRQMELVYMGVTPEARGSGVGKRAVAAAQSIAVEKSAERLVLAVDTRNTPAKSIYRAAGLKAWTSRTVFIRSRTS